MGTGRPRETEETSTVPVHARKIADRFDPSFQTGVQGEPQLFAGGHGPEAQGDCAVTGRNPGKEESRSPVFVAATTCCAEPVTEHSFGENTGRWRNFHYSEVQTRPSGLDEAFRTPT